MREVYMRKLQYTHVAATSVLWGKEKLGTSSDKREVTFIVVDVPENVRDTQVLELCSRVKLNFEPRSGFRVSFAALMEQIALSSPGLS